MVSLVGLAAVVSAT